MPFGYTAANPTAGNPRALAQIADVAGTFIVCDTAQLTRAAFGDPSVNLAPETWNEHQERPTIWQVVPPAGFTGDATANYTRTPGDVGNELRRPIPRHNGGSNVIYCDGHAKWSKITAFLGVTPDRPKGWPYRDPRNSWDDQ
jgi:prepilin-type processing-associated H-X9-DG protein